MRRLLASANRGLDLLRRVNRPAGAGLATAAPGWPPGHFYSPLPDLDDVRRRAPALFGTPPRTLAGIELEVDDQLALLAELAPLAAAHPWSPERRPGVRYHFDNPNFQQGEALVLLAMARRLRPRRVVEVGCGFSSAALLDIDERFLDGATRCTFVEPHADLLRSLLRERDGIDLRARPVQDVDPALFTELAAGDLLLIDSTHVAKVGSDVNHLVHAVLPRLAVGVHVAVHDLYWPFEYPKAWVLEGRAWNEAYVLRAFLSFNAAFRVTFFNDYLATFHAEAFAQSLPEATASPGSSLWLRRVG